MYCTVGRCLVTTSAFFASIDNGLDGAPRRADRSGNGKIDNRQAPSIPGVVARIRAMPTGTLEFILSSLTMQTSRNLWHLVLYTVSNVKRAIMAVDTRQGQHWINCSVSCLLSAAANAYPGDHKGWRAAAPAVGAGGRPSLSLSMMMSDSLHSRMTLYKNDEGRNGGNDSPL